MKYTFLVFSFLTSLVLIFSCQQDVAEGLEHTPVLPEVPFDYLAVMAQIDDFKMPERINSGLAQFETDVISTSGVRTPVQSNAIATLGRVLFYDNRMSKNNSISCASCHKQTHGFADDQRISVGFGGEMTTRNSMSIVNPIVNETFFWDGRTRNLEVLSLEPVFNHVEMGITSSTELINKLEGESYYRELFQEAYGSARINEEGIQTALAQFVASIFSNDTKFDQGIPEDFQNFSELEKLGMALFFSERTNCSSCHNGINFSSPTGFVGNPYGATAGTTNIGLDLVYEDKGFAEGKFKIPSLRNIALTAPYMHDGRFSTIKEVIQHYNENIKPHHELDPKLHVEGIPVSLNLTGLEVDALEAFLNTLTSPTIAFEEKFSNPFKS